MESTLFNIPANTLRPGPTLTIVRAADGKTTGTMDFTCRKFDVGRPIIQSLLAKGTPLITLYPQAGTEFEYLVLDAWTSRDEPGGITVVSCEFRGVDLGEGGDFSFDQAIVYIRNNSLKEEPIWTNDQFKELTTAVRDAIKEAAEGRAYLADDTIKKSSNDEVLATLDETDLEWYDLIVRQGNETYLVATSEWTKSATGRGGLSDSQLSDFGKIDNPPGSPGAPTGHTWLFTGATENINIVGSGANSYSLTWTSGKWPPLIYAATP